MGNCECLRGEPERSELNIHFRENNYNNDYDSNPNSKARGGNKNPFNMLNDSGEADNLESNKKITVSTKIHLEELPKEDNTNDVNDAKENENLVIEDLVTKEEENKDEVVKEEDLVITIDNKDSSLEAQDHKNNYNKTNMYSTNAEDMKTEIVIESDKKTDDLKKEKDIFALDYDCKLLKIITYY